MAPTPFTTDATDLETLAAHSSGEGFDVVLDAAGSLPAMEKGFDHVAQGGRYVLVSVVRESISFMAPDFHRKEMTLLGSRNAANEDFDRVIAAIRDDRVPVDRMITHRTNLRDAQADISRWASAKSDQGDDRGCLIGPTRSPTVRPHASCSAYGRPTLVCLAAFGPIPPLR